MWEENLCGWKVHTLGPGAGVPDVGVGQYSGIGRRGEDDVLAYFCLNDIKLVLSAKRAGARRGSVKHRLDHAAACVCARFACRALAQARMAEWFVRA